jgi:predicted RNA binding protein with dsRBD fold (UPF0201 family)
VVAEVHVAEGVGRVQAALRVKLGQIQLQTHSLQDAVVLVKTELGKLSRAQQRLSTLHTHLQDKLVVNRGRQQVRRDVIADCTAQRDWTGPCAGQAQLMSAAWYAHFFLRERIE